MKNRWQWLLLIAIIGLAGLAIYQTSETRNETLPKIGFKAPPFSLPSLEGQSYSLETLNGKPVVINFWASWCGPCKMEAPELERLYAKYRGQLEIYAVNATASDSAKDAAAFAERYQFTFPVLLDEKGELVKKYRVGSFPTTFFVNRDGTIADLVIGPMDSQAADDKWKRLLKQPGPEGR